ncbi:hypothetical protein CPT03_16815 [Pedobacter ginsengisoli]|uniref:Outer membrane protein beta-barrel domain-containing protein n=1 Tax=Pedobacter ginsengisoli TaxID=363852 RepID=A0A2D1U8R3_9SPHI|nr:hypothetical protein [Pedobacter ginsengisoli]ATP58009.1 hypothetical protein CPT03_16815 [Pedobacter ginsengisoli]
MKKPLLLILFLFTTITAFSQMNGDYNYSIAFRGYSMVEMPKVFNETSSDRFTDAYLNGVMVKFNDNQFSYRLNGTYYNKSKRFFNECETCQEANGKLLDYSFKVGFEKNFNYSRVQPYFGFDLGYRYSRFKGSLQNKNQLRAMSSDAAIVGQDIESIKQGIVVSPVLGVKISPIPQLSVFAEGNLDLFYSFEKQKTILQDIDNTRTVNNDRKTEFLLNPFSVGIQIHLGSNK